MKKLQPSYKNSCEVGKTKYLNLKNCTRIKILFTNDGGLQVDEDSAGNVLAGAGLAEEGVEAVISATNSLVRGHLAVRLDAVLKAVELPAGIADLDSGLSNVDGDALALERENPYSGTVTRWWPARD